MMEIECLVRYYDRFIEILKQTAMGAKEQIEKLQGTAIADEIAIDFGEIGMIYANKLLEYGWITKEQYEVAKSIDEELNTMAQKKELWSESAVVNAGEWENCRNNARKLLLMLGYTKLM